MTLEEAGRRLQAAFRKMGTCMVHSFELKPDGSSVCVRCGKRLKPKS